VLLQGSPARVCNGGWAEGYEFGLWVVWGLPGCMAVLGACSRMLVVAAPLALLHGEG
jgi:hypothetical protein